MKLSLRELRGLGIVMLGGQIKRVSDGVFLVKSQLNPSACHRVEWRNEEWVCDCADHVKRGKPCKHIYAVNFLLDLPRIVLSNSKAFERTCPHCGSADVRPKGFRYNKSGPVRMFRCKNCGRRFKDEASPEHSGAKTALMVIAADLYFKGLSLRDISNHLWQVYGVDVPASTVHRWVRKVANTLRRVFEDVKLEVSDKWLADETIVKINGKPMYLWNIVDCETRVYIASLLTSGRNAGDAIGVIKEAIKSAGKIPRTLITDGLQSYKKALELLGLQIEHIGNAGLAKTANNNIVERLQGTIKEWVKEKRGAGEKFEEIINGYRVYYNYLRPNMALNEESPAKSEEKWISVMLSSTTKHNARKED
ncbi:MAG: IS6 family transposase [Candidatus Bathyarchaeales archaeon]